MKTTPKAKQQENVNVFTLEQLKARYEEFTGCVTAKCRLVTQMVGGQPANESGIRAYVTHHLKLGGRDAEAAVRRILAEEIGERSVNTETGELNERVTYGINVVRRDSFGPWLGNWMIKACLKAAAQRLGIWVEKIGTKGDMSEMARLNAYGVSLLDEDHPERIYLLEGDGTKPAKTYFERFMGRVSGPKGSNSIVHDSECVAPGAIFEFEYRFGAAKLGKEDLLDIFSQAMMIGLGSVKAMECGKFAIDRLEWMDATRARGIKRKDKRPEPKPAVEEESLP